MRRVRYSNNGIPVSDFQAEEYVFNTKNRDLHVSTENVIVWLRVHIKQGLINYKEIEILFKDQVLKIDQNGNLSDSPSGFCDRNLSAFMKLI